MSVEGGKNTIKRLRYLLLGFLCFFCLCILAQVKPSANKRVSSPTASVTQNKQRPQKATGNKNKKSRKNKKREPNIDERNRGKGLTRIDLIHADEAREDNFAQPDIQTLVGSVKLLHKHMYMFCDSALINKKNNTVDAFNHVKMKQGDTLFIFGDYLHYDGITQIAQLRGKVKMVNRKTTLLTDSLNYDRIYDLAYYFEGGTVMDANNVLTSDWGEYSLKRKVATFNHSVKLVNPRFVLSSDTLKYSTKSKVATILGPSNIVSDKSHIYSTRGTYNTAKEQAWLFDRSVLTNGGRRLIGDSVYYNKKKSYSEAFRNVTMKDSINKNMLKGDYCYYNEKTGKAFATRKALGIDYSQKDSMFIHGDTLMLNTFNQKTDSMYRIIKAYHKVRMFRNDLQGVCDSLVYNSKDSCLTMYKDPIIWNGKQQLLGEVIHAYFNDSTITWAHIVNQALTVEEMDSIHYNQITGKEIKAYFKNKELDKVDVISNVNVVYYPLDKDSTMMFMNTSETSLLNLYLKDRKMDKIVMSPKSNGTLYPMAELPGDKMRLSNFAWFDYIRPKDKNDLFVWRPKSNGLTLRKTQEDSRLKENIPLRDLLK
jgi:lipopolysaccharide export system protein LptA